MVGLLSLSLFFRIGYHAEASFLRPYGGNVTSTNISNVICTAGVGPVTQRSAGTSPTTPYFYQYGSTQTPTSSKWVLGLYTPVTSFTDCYTPYGPYRVPYPVFRVKLWGTN